MEVDMSGVEFQMAPEKLAEKYINLHKKGRALLDVSDIENPFVSFMQNDTSDPSIEVSPIIIKFRGLDKVIQQYEERLTLLNEFKDIVDSE